MDITFTGRGLPLSEEIRTTAEHKLGTLSRLEPRATSLDIEVIGEHHPKPDGVKRIEAALRIPRKTFRAEAEADDVVTAIDRVKQKLERQLRDHHRKRRVPKKRGLQSATSQGPAEPGT